MVQGTSNMHSAPSSMPKDKKKKRFWFERKYDLKKQEVNDLNILFCMLLTYVAYGPMSIYYTHY